VRGRQGPEALYQGETNQEKNVTKINTLGCAVHPAEKNSEWQISVRPSAHAGGSEYGAGETKATPKTEPRKGKVVE